MQAAVDFRSVAEALARGRSTRHNLGLTAVQTLLDALGNPHRGHRGCLVAGTNGKGSVCALVDSICRAAGLRTVRLTKPHLISWCERIAVSGNDISERRFAETYTTVTAAASRLSLAPTTFDILTAMGAVVAEQEQPDVLICEVGMGGRLDSTAIFDLGVAVITNVELDHCDVLGETVEAIALEKAGIIKPENQVISAAQGPALDRIQEVAAAVSAQSVCVPANMATIQSNLRGEFQKQNTAVALAVVDALRNLDLEISGTAVLEGLKHAELSGRMHVIDGRPRWLLDGGHNPAAIKAGCAAAIEIISGPFTLVFGTMRDKDSEAMLRILQRMRPHRVIFTRGSNERFAEPALLQKQWAALDPAQTSEAYPDVKAVLQQLGQNSTTQDWVFVTGSLALVGELLAVRRS